MTQDGGDERLNQRLPKLLDFWIEFLVGAQPLPRGRFRHGDRRRQVGGRDGGDYQPHFI